MRLLHGIPDHAAAWSMDCCWRSHQTATGVRVTATAKALGSATLAAVLAACGQATSGTATTVADSPSRSPARDCVSAPPASPPVADELGPAPLTGPARDDVADGKFVRQLSLDDGALRIDVPRPADVAGYPLDAAVCEVLASTFSNNGPVGPHAANTMAAGLARVTVDRNLVGTGGLGQVGGVTTTDGVTSVNPTYPAATEYRDRLAWVVVLEQVVASSCPGAFFGQSPPPSYDEPGHHGYGVFLVDAADGGHAILYTERRNGGCPGTRPDGPWIDVPLTSVSVPWQFVSERADRSSAQISFDVTTCDGYDGVILAEERTDPALVRVVVRRPFGPPCSTPTTVTEKMRAALIGTDLPPRIEHAPTGPYVE